MLRLKLYLAVALATVLSLAPAMAQTDGPWFETEQLNEGLGPAPDGLDRSTPRATMESLYRFAADGEWLAAAHLLNLNDLDTDAQRELGAGLALQLVTVLNRKVVIDWSQILDRPDALDVTESSNAATAGLSRKSLRLWEFSGNPVPMAIRMHRIKPANGEPVWVFSPRTVDDIDALYAAYGPSELERWLPDRLRSEAIAGVMWWEIIGLPLMLALAALTGFGVHRGVRALRGVVGQSIPGNVVRAMATPVTIAAVTTVLWWGGSTIFVFSGQIDAVMGPIVATGFTVAVLMLIVNVIEEILNRVVGFDDVDLTLTQEAEDRDRATRIAALRRILLVVVFLIGAGIVLSSANVFRSLGFSILASAGAITLVIGFAARQILGNIMASLQIALNKSARIGDRVVYKDALCHVERINFTYVQLRDWTGVRMIVPVEEFASESFENWTIQEPEMLRLLKFKLSAEVDVEELRAAFERVLDDLEQSELDDRDKAKVAVADQDVFGLDIWFFVPCVNPNTSWDVACQAREALVREIRDMERDAGIEIFPDATAAEAA